MSSEQIPPHVLGLVNNYKGIVDAHNIYTQFQNYEEIRASIQELVTEHDNLRSEVIGYGADRTLEYPNGRPIEAIFATTPGTENSRPWALLMMEHENEMSAPITLLTITKIFGHHPELLEELGYNFIIIPAAHPDGIALQRWIQDHPELIDWFAYLTGTARGAGTEQNAWAYPFSYRGLTFDNPTPEVQRLMALMLKYMPEALHLPHASPMHESYDFTTAKRDDLFAAITLVANLYGFTMQTSATEDPSMKLHDSKWPGIFEMHTVRDEIDDIFPADEDIPEGLIWRSGDNAYAWLTKVVPKLKCLVNEFSYADSADLRDTSLSETTKDQMLADGKRFTAELVQVVERALVNLQSAIETTDSAAAGRLIRSINWWLEITKQGFANEEPPDTKSAGEFLTKSECIAAERYKLAQMVFAGQTCSLAVLLGNEAVAVAMTNEIKRRFLEQKEKYSIQPSSLPQLVGAQVLTHLVALRLD